MSKLSKEQVENIANLARISIGDKELRGLQEDLGAILEYVDNLKSIDTSKTEPIAHISGLVNQVRKDKPKKSLAEDEDKLLLGEAPSKKDGYIKVKQVLTK